MSAIEIILGILVILVSLFIIAVCYIATGFTVPVLRRDIRRCRYFPFQNKARTFDATLARLIQVGRRGILRAGDYR